MNEVVRKEKDYLRWDHLNLTEKSTVNTKFRKFFKPIENTSQRKNDVFIVDWQVCDEEHLQQTDS